MMLHNLAKSKCYLLKVQLSGGMKKKAGHEPIVLNYHGLVPYQWAAMADSVHGGLVMNLKQSSCVVFI